MDTEEWEMALLYLAAWNQASEVFSLVTVEDFTPGQCQELAAIMERGQADGEINPQWVADECIRLGRPSTSFVSNVITMAPTASVRYYASRVRNESIRRYAHAASTRFTQRLSGNLTDPLTAVEELRSDLDSMPRVETQDDDTWDIWDLLALEEQPENYTIPGILRANERLVLTGSEGAGKSVFIFQLLTGAAWGVDTFNHTRCAAKEFSFSTLRTATTSRLATFAKSFLTYRN